MQSGAVETRPRPLRRGDENLAVYGLAAHLCQLMTGLNSRAERVLLPLTAGRDSRTIFAALVAAGTRFESYTYLQAGAASRVDADIAARLSQRHGIRHHVVRPKPRDSLATALFVAHTGDASGDNGEANAARGFHHIFRPGDLILPGTIFEIGRRFYAQQFSKATFDYSRRTALDLQLAFRDTSRVHPPLRAWYLHRRRYPIADLDYVDLFYLDQRLSGWMAAQRQARDAFIPAVLAPASSWRCLEYLLSSPPERRETSHVQMGAMEALLSSIKVIPINPKPLINRVRGTLARSLIRFAHRKARPPVHR